jgi:DNA mismatch repair protein MutL
VRVERLFENVPVRREYLRSAGTEFARISSWLASFALAYPGVAFTLRHDGKDVWTMPASDDPRERLAMVFGREPATSLIALDGEPARTIDGSIRGFISAPGADRADRRLQLLFVNGRLLRSALVSAAWTAAYATFTMTQRHPYGVVFLELPPEQVDPNVHPTKSDVRLRYGSQVFEAVRRSMRATLQAHAAARLRTNTGAAAGGVSAMPSFANGEFAATSLFADEPGREPAGERRMRVIEQIDRTYILASDGDALLLVDQHAAHERIAYESIVDAAAKGAPSAPLLVPRIVELDGEQTASVEQSIELLREGGLEIEPFGARTFRITATPAGYGARSVDMLGLLEDVASEPKQRDVRERIWASLACHSVTVAGERLEHPEMTTLIERLQQCRNPMHCPHGRPTMVRIDPQAIARMFKR